MSAFKRAAVAALPLVVAACRHGGGNNDDGIAITKPDFLKCAIISATCARFRSASPF